MQNHDVWFAAQMQLLISLLYVLPVVGAAEKVRETFVDGAWGECVWHLRDVFLVCKPARPTILYGSDRETFE